LTFSHYRFKQFLKYKAFEYGKTVIDVNEAWTSKTVSWTGEINKRLGGAKQITSRLTGETMDRDYNGARGIFLRALGDHPILHACVQDVSALNAT
jgi:putative transposase